MKKTLSVLFLFLVLESCSPKVDEPKARMMIENLLSDLKNENYASLDKYYSDLSKESEPMEKKIDKFKQLKEVTGAIQSFELLNSKQDYDSDKGINQLELKYKVKCEKVSLVETLIIIHDEGAEKIIYQNIENLK